MLPEDGCIQIEAPFFRILFFVLRGVSFSEDYYHMLHIKYTTSFRDCQCFPPDLF